MVKRTNLVKLAAQLGTRATQVEYLRGKGVLPTQVTCQKCGEFVSKTEYCTNKGTFKYYVISFEAFSDFHPPGCNICFSLTDLLLNSWFVCSKLL